jgi:hypothetical protein
VSIPAKSSRFEHTFSPFSPWEKGRGMRVYEQNPFLFVLVVGEWHSTTTKKLESPRP